MLGEARLLLIQVHRNNVEMDRRMGFHVEQNIEHGITVFAAGQTHHDPITVFNHVEVSNGFAHMTTQSLVQLVEVVYLLGSLN